jgi:hypothetical protein
MRRPPGRAGLAVATAIAAVTMLALAGCAGSRDTGSTTAQGAAPQPAAGAGGQEYAARDKAAAAGSAAGSAEQVAKPAAGASAGVVKARVIRTAQVTVEVSGRLNVAAAGVKQVAKQFGGHVESETTGLGDAVEQKPAEGSDKTPMAAQAGESLLVLRVPEPKLDDAIAAVTATPGGTVLSQTSSSQDVTGDIADLTSRVASQRASLDRVRALMARATSLQDVVTLEAELSRRQSDLEALESRLATVSDQADLATLTVLLRTPAAKESEPDTGFLAGLESGWRAVQASTTVVLTVLGALLPVAVIAVLLGWPALRLLRRRARRTPTPPPAAGWPLAAPPASPVPVPPAPAPAAPAPVPAGTGTGTPPTTP